MFTALFQEKIESIFHESKKYPVISFSSGEDRLLGKAVYHLLRTQSADIVWLGLEEADNNTAHFWNKFLLLGSNAGLPPFAKLRRLSFPLFESDYVLIRDAFADLFLENRSCRLVLEHFHRIHNPLILEFFKKLALLSVRNLQLVALTRKLPLKYTAELIMAGLLYPASAELHLTPREIAAVFSHHGAALTPSGAEHLAREYGGEVSVLGAILRRRVSEGAPTAPLPGKEALFLAAQAEHPAGLLMGIAVPETFDEHLWSTLGGEAEAFSAFVARHPFVGRIPGSGNCFFSDDFRTFLLDSPADPLILSAQRRAAVRRHEAQGETVLALIIAEHLGDPALLHRLIRKLFAPDHPHRDDLWLLQRLRAMPEGSRPENLTTEMIFAALSAVCGEWADVQGSVAFLDIAAAAPGVPPDVLGEYHALKAMLICMDCSGDLEGHVTAALELLPGGSRLFPRVFHAGESLPPLPGWPRRSPGERAGMTARMIDCASLITRLFAGGCAGLGLYLRAEELFYQNLPEEAQRLCHQAISLASDHGQYAVILACQFLLLRLCLMEGQVSRADAILKVMREMAGPMGGGALYHRFVLIQAWHHLMTGERLSKLPKFVTGGKLSSASILGGSQWLAHEVYALYLLRKRHDYELWAFLGAMEALLQTGGGGDGRMLEYLTLRAVVAKNLGRTEALHDAMTQAYRLSEESGMVAAFILHAKELQRILARLLADGGNAIPQSWLQKTHRLCHHHLGLKTSGGDFERAFGITPKEMEVLRLITLGKSNLEIAKELATTVPTVKWYAQQIYSKLGVKNRTEAANKAFHHGITS